MADGQLVAGRVTGHGDLCLRLERALSLFILLLKETAGTPPALRLQSIIMGNINEVNVKMKCFLYFIEVNKGCCSKFRYPMLEKTDVSSVSELCFRGVQQHSGVK